VLFESINLPPGASLNPDAVTPRNFRHPVLDLTDDFLSENGLLSPGTTD
jgi:hypothetical protein